MQCNAPSQITIYLGLIPSVRAVALPGFLCGIPLVADLESDIGADSERLSYNKATKIRFRGLGETPSIVNQISTNKTVESYTSLRQILDEFLNYIFLNALDEWKVV